MTEQSEAAVVEQEVLANNPKLIEDYKNSDEGRENLES